MSFKRQAKCNLLSVLKIINVYQYSLLNPPPQKKNAQKKKKLIKSLLIFTGACNGSKHYYYALKETWLGAVNNSSTNHFLHCIFSLFPSLSVCPFFSFLAKSVIAIVVDRLRWVSRAPFKEGLSKGPNGGGGGCEKLQ